MKPYLLDVNLLISLAWPSHIHHAQAQEWFVRRRAAGFRTCPLTQLGFVRISSNPNFSRDAVSPGSAMALLDRITAMEEHKFWPDDLPLAKAVDKKPVTGHRQITDAYLAALAMAHGGILATLDRGILLLPGLSTGSVEVLSTRPPARP